MDYWNFEVVVTENKTLYPASNIMEITDSIHLTAVKFPAISDLAKSVLLNAYFSSLSDAVGVHLWRDMTHLYLDPIRESQ